MQKLRWLKITLLKVLLYLCQDKEHWEDQNGQINLKEEIISANQTFTKRCVGRIVSKFPKKKRISKDNH